MITPTIGSLELVREIAKTVPTFHHHYHILYDIATSYDSNEPLVYLEIGAYAGGSASLMIQRPNTTVISIDLGDIVHPNKVCENVYNHNKHNNDYTYIIGNSQNPEISDRVSKVPVDILFIDGDHSYFGVWSDFLYYSKLVKPNGYIVFDDYNDFTHNRMVKSAVDHIVNQLRDDFDIIGTFTNDLNAHGYTNDKKDGNCFVIRKKNKLSGFQLPIAIITTTYYKPDHSTIPFLKQTLDSIFSQTYQNFKLFLIGDDFKPVEKLENLLNSYPKDKIYFENLNYARERYYHKEGKKLWLYGGVNALNYGIDIALSQGYDYIAHCDHDDLWYENHLSEIVKCIEITNADFVCTVGMHANNIPLPLLFETTDQFVKYTPIYNQILHSSVCMNFNTIPLRYRDLQLEYGKTDETSLPADGDLWERVRKYVLKNNLRSFCVNKVTCLHDIEKKDAK